MNFVVDNDVKKLGIKIKAIIIFNIDNKSENKDYNLWRESKVKELVEKYKNYDIKSDEIIENFYKIHESVGVPRRKNLPASENLIKLLTKRESLVNINKVVDIYNIISIESKLCLGAHDIDKINGIVHLKITDGTEKFLPLGTDELKKVNKGEYAFVDDDNNVICWLDIRQVDKTKVTEDSKNVLYFIIGNQATPDVLLDEVANDIITLTIKYCGGSCERV